MIHPYAAVFGAAAVALGWAGPLALEEGATHESGPILYVGACILTLSLVVAHLAAPRLRPWLDGRTELVGSFGGGMAAAYVFLHLLPELDEGHAVVGAAIFLVPLVGFLVYYLSHKWLLERSRREGPSTGVSFAVRLANLSVYNGLIIYGTPQLRAQVGWAAAPLTMALLVHLVHTDYTFSREFPALFDSIGRRVLAAASAVALLLALATRPRDSLSDVLIAYLAGSVLYNVFREEIPDESRSKVLWFVAGIVVFAACALPSIR